MIMRNLKSSGRNAIIELKTKDKQAINKIVQMVKTNNMEKKAIIISFDYDSLQYIRSTLNKNIKLCFLAREATEENILKAQRLNNSIIGLNGNNITEEFINSAHQKNVEVNTWTVDSYAERAKLYYMGVDYITTNNMNA